MTTGDKVLIALLGVLLLTAAAVITTMEGRVGGMRGLFSLPTPTPEPNNKLHLNIIDSGSPVFTIREDGSYGCLIPENECRAALSKLVKNGIQK